MKRWAALLALAAMIAGIFTRDGTGGGSGAGRAVEYFDGADDRERSCMRIMPTKGSDRQV